MLPREAAERQPASLGATVKPFPSTWSPSSWTGLSFITAGSACIAAAAILKRFRAGGGPRGRASRWTWGLRCRSGCCGRAQRMRFTGCRSEEHTSELQSLRHLVCRLLLEKKNHKTKHRTELDTRDTQKKSKQNTVTL